MGWKGTVRSIRAAVREAERESKRKQRELEKEQKYLEKIELLEQATNEVEIFEDYIERIQSLHKYCSEPIDWLAIMSSNLPKEPLKYSTHENEAKFKANNYRPSLLDKVFKKSEKKKGIFNEAIVIAQKQDQKEYETQLKNWHNEVREWEENTNLAKLLVSGDGASKLDVINEFNCFSEISDIGSEISFQIHNSSILEAEINIHGEEIVPKKKKSLLQSGKLSVTNMPKGSFFEIYQDYVCSCTLRVANELFSILPDKAVIVTAVDDLLDTTTGHLKKQPILSVFVPRQTLRSLNINNIDPSDAMSNFIHNVSFKKQKVLVS